MARAARSPLRIRSVWCYILLLSGMFVLCANMQMAHGHGYHEHRSAKFTQPDGTVLHLRFHGSDYYARTETFDGYTVVFDPKTKIYYYAGTNADGSELLPTPHQAGKADPKALGLPKGVRLTPQARAAKIEKRRNEMEAVLKDQEKWESLKAANRNYRSFKNELKKQEKAGKKGFVIPMGTIFPDSEIPESPQMAEGEVTTEGTGGTGPESAPPSFTLTDDVVGLTILVDFSDDPGTAVTQSQVDDWANKPGYTGFSNAGSVYDYFYTQSNGRLRYSNNVTYYVRVPQPRSYYDDTAKDSGLCGRLLLNDALNVLIADGYDFSSLTTKSGGNIRACNVFFAGADSGVWAQGLWPHRWVLSPKKEVAPGMYVYDYQITNIGTTTDLKIGTFLHENGHMLLAYPDFYSYDGNAARIQYFSLMASGNHAGSGRHPTNLDSYMKEASGWMDVVDLTSASNQRCAAQVDGNLVYRYANPSNAADYFMWEVRDNTGWEGPRGGASNSVNPATGLLTWHVLESGSNTYSSIFTNQSPNADYTKPYELLVVEANPSSPTTPWYDDPTPGSNDAFSAATRSSITGSSTPSALKFWDTTGNTGRTVASNCEIHSISADGPSMTFVVGNGAPSGSPTVVLSRNNLYTTANFGTNAPTETFTICNGQGGTLSYSVSDNASWLSCNVTTGTATTEHDTVTITFNTVGLTPGNHIGTITVSDGGSSTQTTTVNLIVFTQPTLAANPTSMSIGGIEGIASDPVSLDLNNIGGGSCNYTVSKTQPWLSLSHTSGTLVLEIDRIEVTCDATGLAPGTYNDTITISSSEASNSPLTVPVTFTVASSDMVVTSPNGGESFSGGGAQTITWVSSLGGTVRIDLFKAGVLNRTIANSETNDGTYSWAVPLGLNGTDYRIQITSIEQPSKVDLSDGDITISSCSSFESGLDGWVQSTADNIDWSRATGSTPSGSTGPTAASDGNYYLYVEASSPNFPDITAIIYKDLDFAGINQPRVTFDYHMYGSSMGTLYFEVSTNGGTTWDTPAAWSLTGDQGNAWVTNNVVDLGAYAGQQVRVRFRGVTGSNYFSDMAIDNVCFEEGQSNGVQFASAAFFNVTESAGSATITVDRVGDAGAAISVDYATSNGSATTAGDYNASSGTLSWAGGDATSKTFTIPITNDSTDEARNETVTLTLSNPIGTTIFDTNPGTLTIVDDDNNPPVVNAGPDQTIDLVGSGVSEPVAGDSIYLNAGLDDGANNIWEDSRTLWSPTIDTASVTYVANAGSSYPGITAAYDFPGGLLGTGGCEGISLQNLGGGRDTQPITLEIWFKPDASASYPANGQVLWETGGGTGFGIFYRDGFVETAHDSNAQRLSTDVSALTGEFIQVTVTYDTTTTIDNYKLYINGELKATGSRNDTDMCGGDNSGLGERGQSNVGGAGGGDSSTESFDGKIAIFRSYHNRILNAAEVLQNFQFTADPGGVTVNLDGTITDAAGEVITSTWTLFNGPAAVSIANPSAVDTTADFTTEGVYTLRLTANDGDAEISDDVIITVNPSSVERTLTYNGNGNTGGAVPVDSNSPYQQGDTVTVLDNTGSLVRTGYVFAGWNTAADGSGDGYVATNTFVINANITLYAQWTPNTYAVTLDKQSGTGGTNSVTATYGAPMPAATPPTQDGFVFGGYYTGTNGSGTSYYDFNMASARNWDIAAPTTLYAKWTIAHTVTFQTDGTAGATLTGQTTQLVPDGSNSSAVTANAPGGHYFVNWTSGGSPYSNNNPLMVANVTGDMTLTANFALIPSIAISDDGIAEGVEDGEVILVTLSDGVFAASITAGNWTVSGLPAGVSKGAVTRLSDTTVSIALSGNRTVDYDSDITGASVTCAAAEVVAYTSSLSANSGVTFSANNDAEFIEIADDGWIEEGSENGELITIILHGGTFAPSLSSSNWSVDNRPANVSMGALNRVSDQVATITLLNNRTGTYGGNDITNIKVTCTMAEYADNSGGGDLSANSGVTLRALNAGSLELQNGLNGYTGTADTHIYKGVSNANFVNEVFLDLNSHKNQTSYGLMRFDLSGIPAGSNIISASLEFTAGGANVGTVEVYNTTAAWNASTATWDSANALVGATLYGSLTIADATLGTTLPAIALSPALVQGWFDTPAFNTGFAIQTSFASGNSSNMLTLCSANHASGNPTLNSYRPKLTISYDGGGPGAPEMTVQGQGRTINSGDTTPNGADDTNFGSVATGGSTVVHTFTINNDGDGDLSLTGTPAVEMTGANAGDFTVTADPATTLVGGGTTTFQVTFAPSAGGTRAATISIANNDSNEAPYTFAITGEGIGPAATYTVTYSGNTNTGGSAPVDGASPYAAGSSVTVLNQGTLVKSGHGFKAWNTASDGSGTTYAPGASFIINADTTLHAIWDALPSVNAGTDQVVYLSGSAEAWTPADTATVAWYDADDASTITKTGTAVSQWNDKSGNAYHMKQTNGTAQPVYTATDSVLGGRPSISTGPDFKYLTMDQSPAVKRMYVVTYYGDGTQSTWTNHNALVGSADGSVRLTGRAGGNKVFDSTGDAKNFDNNGTTYRNGSTSNTNGQTNGLPITGEIFTVTAEAAKTAQWRLLANNANYTLWDGGMGEIIFTDGTEDLATQQKIEGYLTWKWGLETKLDSAHPYSTTNSTGGPMKSVASATVTLAGSASDVESSPSATWSDTGTGTGTGPVNFVDVNALNSDVTFFEAGTYVLQLSADDGVNAAQTDQVVITVNPALSPYDTWKAGSFANAFTDTASTSDPDGDGWANFVEFAFGTDPTTSDSGPLSYVGSGDVTTAGMPVLEGPTGGYKAVFLRRKDHAAAGLTYAVQFTAELGTWTASAAGLQVVTGAGSSGDYEAVSVPFPATVPLQGGGNGAPQFFRVSVTTN